MTLIPKKFHFLTLDPKDKAQKRALQVRKKRIHDNKISTSVYQSGKTEYSLSLDFPHLGRFYKDVKTKGRQMSFPKLHSFPWIKTKPQKMALTHSTYTDLNKGTLTAAGSSFKNLKILDLADCKIQEVKQFPFLKNLESLKIHVDGKFFEKQANFKLSRSHPKLKSLEFVLTWDSNTSSHQSRAFSFVQDLWKLKNLQHFSFETSAFSPLQLQILKNVLTNLPQIFSFRIRVETQFGRLFDIRESEELLTQFGFNSLCLGSRSITFSVGTQKTLHLFQSQNGYSFDINYLLRTFSCVRSLATIGKFLTQVEDNRPFHPEFHTLWIQDFLTRAGIAKMRNLCNQVTQLKSLSVQLPITQETISELVNLYELPCCKSLEEVSIGFKGDYFAPGAHDSLLEEVIPPLSSLKYLQKFTIKLFSVHSFEFLEKILRHYPNLRSLTLSITTEIFSSQFMNVKIPFESLPELEQFRLDGKGLDKPSLRHIRSSLCKLKELNEVEIASQCLSRSKGRREKFIQELKTSSVWSSLRSDIGPFDENE